MNKSKIIFYSFLITLLISAVYFRANTASVYSNLGNFYYKRNDINKAQMFYEKSFANGNTDFKTRELFVNSLINSPLNLATQKKLIKIAEDNIQDKAKFNAQKFLYDLKREINNQYPNNYIKQATLNQQIVRWGKFPVTYTLKNKNIAPSEYVNEIRAGFSTWERVGIPFVEVDKNANIVIDFLNNTNKEIEYGKKYVIAYTVPNISSKKLNEMDIHFYIQTPDGQRFTNNQIYNTAIHEIFHALGFMGHSFNKDSIMYFSQNSDYFINDTRLNLTVEDINTLKLLYKIAPDITNDNELAGEYLPYLVLGGSDEVSISKVKEAKNYIYNAPTLPSGYIDLAESMVARKNYPQAIKCLEKALQLAETKDMFYIIYYNLEVVYIYIGHDEMSLEYIKQAEEIKNAEELHFLRAEILAKSDIEQAIAEYEYLTKIAPNNIEYATRYANLYIKKRNYFKARKILKLFIKNNPNMKNNSKLSNYGILLFP